MKGTRPDPETLAWMIAFSKQQVREFRDEEIKKTLKATLDPETRAMLIEFSRQQVREFMVEERKKVIRSSTSSRKAKAPRGVKLSTAKGSGRKTGIKASNANRAKVAV